MPGRKPKPTATRKAEGHAGHRAIPCEPDFDKMGTTPPMALSARGRKVWNNLREQLDKAGILKTTDQYILAAACDTWDKYLTAAKANDRLNSLEYLKQFRQLAASLGLSPTDRARLGLKPEGKKDELDEFEKKGDEIRKNIIPAGKRFSKEG
jgi:phage terminase small subunit